MDRTNWQPVWQSQQEQEIELKRQRLERFTQFFNRVNSAFSFRKVVVKVQNSPLEAPAWSNSHEVTFNSRLIGELNTRFSNKLSNKLQIGLTQLRDFRSPHSNSETFPLVDILNNGNIYTTFGYEMYTYNNKLNTDVYQFNDILTYYKGAHEITLGTQNSYKKYQNAFAPGYQGVYQFNSLTDFYNSANNGLINQ